MEPDHSYDDDPDNLEARVLYVTVRSQGFDKVYDCDFAVPLAEITSQPVDVVRLQATLGRRLARAMSTVCGDVADSFRSANKYKEQGPSTP